MSKIDGATLMARSLKQQGVDCMFGIVGSPVQPSSRMPSSARIASPFNVELATACRSQLVHMVQPMQLRGRKNVFDT